MKLASSISIYGGGPGSGCNPEVGKCGRPPGSGSDNGKNGDASKIRLPYSEYLKARYDAIMSKFKDDPTAGTKANPIDAGQNLEMAQVLIAEGKHVTLDQPDEIATLVAKIKQDAEAVRAQGEKPPDWNLADISVKGTNLFAQDNLEIPRVEMPQLAGLVDSGSKAAKLLPANADLSKDQVDLAPQFIKQLKSEGVGVKDVTIQASHLRATQNELDGAKVGAIADRMAEGKLPAATIFITRDNYIVDGHHRWAATIVNDAKNGKMGDLWMSAHKLDIDIGTALTKARDFQKQWGVSAGVIGKVIKSAAQGYVRRWIMTNGRITHWIVVKGR